MRYTRPKPIDSDSNIHPLVQWAWTQMAMKKLTHEFVAEKAGLSTATLRNWARGRTTPRLIDIEAVVNVLGSDLSVKKSANED